MEDMIVKLVVLILVPILLLCGLLEKRSRHILLSVCAGCVMCLVSYYLNNWIYDVTGCTYFHLTTSIAPFIEECAKFVPILLYSIFVSRDKNDLLSISFAVGMGFAIIENSFMLAQSVSTATVAWLFVRGIGTGLMHGMSTTIVGIGIYFATIDKRMVFTGTAAMLFLAMMYHGTYNSMVITEVIKYLGIFIPIISYSAVIFVMNSDKFKDFASEIKEEFVK